jgi:hypothetical protein
MTNEKQIEIIFQENTDILSPEIKQEIQRSILEGEGNLTYLIQEKELLGGIQLNPSFALTSDGSIIEIDHFDSQISIQIGSPSDVVKAVFNDLDCSVYDKNDHSIQREAEKNNLIRSGILTEATYQELLDLVQKAPQLVTFPPDEARANCNEREQIKNQAGELAKPPIPASKTLNQEGLDIEIQSHNVEIHGATQAALKEWLPKSMNRL